MSRRSDFLRLGVLSLVAAAASGAPAPIAHYRVTLQPPTTPAVVVELELTRAPRNGVTLQAYADREAIQLSHVEVTDGHRRPIRYRLGYRTIESKGKRVDIPYVSVPGSLSGPLRVRYQVRPTRREGDDHMGFTGTCFGEINDRFALLTGRNLFLVPEGIRGLRAAVRFSLPSGWRAVTTWRERGPEWSPGPHGTIDAEALVAGTIGLGQFRERVFRTGRTEYRVAIERGISATQEARLVSGLERATRFVHRLFRRGPVASYVTIVTPPATSGDEIAGEGWSTGQGGTLAPITAGRLRLYADRLISTYLLYPPTRTEIRDPREYWLVDAVRSWYAWRAVAEAGLVRTEDVTRETALAYLASYRATNIDRNLERMYGAGEPNAYVRSVLAPALLLYLDTILAEGTGRPHPLDPVVARIFRGRVAASLWSNLPSVPNHDWIEFRERYARGNRLVPLERLLPLEPTKAQPPTSGSAGRVLTLAFTSDTHGFLENCGCKVNQSGGVARRAKKLTEIRRRDPALLLLDAGSTFAKPKRSDAVDFLSRSEQDLYLRTMEAMAYDAAAIGTTDLALGPQYFREMTENAATPFLSANVRLGSRPVAPPSMVVSRAGLRVGIVGLLDPPRGGLGEKVFEANTTELTFEDPAAALRREIESLRPRVDLIVVLGRLDPYAIRRVVSTCSGIDVLISSQSDAPTFRVVEGDTVAARSDVSGFLHGTLVLYTAAHQYGLDTARLHVDGENRVTAAEIESFQLGADAGEDSRIRRMLDRFYDSVGRTEAAQVSVRPLFAWDPRRSSGRYVGAQRCAGCHEDEFLQWSSTKHAGAFKTLLDVHRHFQPKCVSCHVVGFGTPHGYKLGTQRETLANVQCEVCHGPGGSHVDAPTAENIRREVPERVCTECHNQEHSDHFVYAEKVPLVNHERDGARELSAAPAAGP